MKKTDTAPALTETQTAAMYNLTQVAVGALNVVANDWDEFDALAAEFTRGLTMRGTHSASARARHPSSL